MDQLAGKTNDLITLGADMASMFGGTTKEAIEAISSALKGEMDPIERYGITPSAASLEAEALSKNILKPVVDSEKVSAAAAKMSLAQSKYNSVVKKHGKDSDEAKRAQIALTSAEAAYQKATAGKVPKLEGESKALAIQSALYAQSADAQGNFMREEDPFEHKRQVALATWADLKEKIGNAFLPAMTAAFGYIGDTALPFIEKLIDGVKGIGAVLVEGNFTESMRNAFNIEEDHPFVGFLFNTRDALMATAGWLQTNKNWLVPLTVAVVAGAAAWKLYNWTTGTYEKIGKTLTNILKQQTVAQWALNAAMNANWIGILVVAIAALVAAFIYLWNTNEGFRNFWVGAWEAIKGAVDWAWKGIQVAIQWIVGGFKWLGGIAAEVWGHIQGAVQVGVEGVKVAAGAVVSFFRDTVAPVFVWLYESVVKPIWKVIATAIAIAVTPIVAAVMFMVWVFKNLVAPVFVWLYENVVKPAFNGIKVVIGFVVGLVQKYMGYWVALFRNVVAPVFVWLYNNIVKPAFNGIKTAISFAWTAIKAIFAVLVDVVRKSVGATFSWLYQYIVKPVFGAIKWVISTWWAGAKILFQQVVNFVRGPLANVFKWLYDKIIKPVWDGISRTISWVWNKGIKPVFDALGSFIRDTVAPVFQKGVDKITKIWDTLREAAKVPIKFVVDKVINGGLIKAFNIVAGWIPGVDEIGEVKIAGFDRGGWTGPGARLDPAGIVHADEFVVRKWARQRFERENPGFLNHVNKHGTMEGYASGGLVRPVRGGKMTSGFGTSRGRYPHAGLDLAVPTGTPVFASMAGRVTRAGWNAITGRSGIGAFLDHEGGRNTYYGHLSRLMVKVGDMVKKGQQIALSGNTGKSSGPHLHWETWTGGKPVNPAPYLNGAMLPVGGVGGGPGGGDNPLQAILDFGGKIAGMFTDRFPGGAHLVNIAKGTGTKLFTDVKGWLDAKLQAIGDVGRDTWGNVKDIFNGPDSEVKKAVRGVAAGYGWNSGRHWDSLNKLISKESSWDPNAQNKGSTAYGLFQFLNSTWGSYGAKTSDPAGQARAGLKYIQDRYGNPENAWRFWKKNRWYADGGLVTPYKYDSGGWLNPGFTPIVNHTRKPEAIYTATQDRDLQTLAEYARGKIEDERNDAKGGGDTYYMTVPKEAGVDDLVSALKFAKRRNRRKGKNG